ncbi:MAG TPA: dTMP kinase [Bradyrhizobium sp.]
MRSRFLVLDGTEGSGKSTQARLLHERLSNEGIDSILVRDPGTTRIGEQIRAILLDPEQAEMSMRCEMLLYMAARAQMMSQVIAPALAAGRTVVGDRFVSSTLAYQLGGDGLTADEIRDTANIAVRGRWPDLTIILDMPPDASLARVNRARDRIEQRPMSYHEQVHRNYLAQVQANHAACRLVSAAGSPEQVHERVWEAIARGSI